VDVGTVLSMFPERKELRRAVESCCMVKHMHPHAVLGCLLWCMLPKMGDVAGILTR
jgi:hypothetical protein